jgi:hypothetical protein
MHVVGNNILAGNDAAVGGGIVHTDYSGDIRSNTFHDNGGGDLHDAGGSGATLTGNEFADPKFLAAGSYQLASDSPCIDSADEVLAPPDDLESFPRPFDGDADSTPVSDRGAYEYPAGEVLSLSLGTDNESVSWQVLPLQGGFNLYRGTVDRLRATGEYTQDPAMEADAALFCNLLPGQVPVQDTFMPAAGQAVYYVVSQVLGGWEGSLGEASGGLPRPNAGLCP